MDSCARCKVQLPRQFLTCVFCDKSLDLDCANITYKRYALFDEEAKKIGNVEIAYQMRKLRLDPTKNKKNHPNWRHL